MSTTLVDTQVSAVHPGRRGYGEGAVVGGGQLVPRNHFVGGLLVVYRKYSHNLAGHFSEHQLNHVLVVHRKYSHNLAGHFPGLQSNYVYRRYNHDLAFFVNQSHCQYLLHSPHRVRARAHHPELLALHHLRAELHLRAQLRAWL